MHATVRRSLGLARCAAPNNSEGESANAAAAEAVLRMNCLREMAMRATLEHIAHVDNAHARDYVAAMRFALMLLLVASAVAQAVSRPPIVGVAHITLRTGNADAARDFYGNTLMLPEENLPGGMEFRVNEHQSVQVMPGLDDPNQDRLLNIAFETTDAERLRKYLASKGVKVPEKVTAMTDGTTGFEVIDPDRHAVQFVQFKREAKSRQRDSLSQHIIHVGIVVADRAAADRFYKDILGFRLMWHGGMTDDVTDWVDMRVPEGTDWLEYMLNVHHPSPQLLGVMHHFALGMPAVNASYAALQKRGVKLTEKPQIGRDGKWQLNLYDPDHTRVELMEPKPVRKPCCSQFVK
jgi:catechol 2,3-dioxygenase-like lactoylglutathione lyase family enzyme